MIFIKRNSLINNGIKVVEIIHSNIERIRFVNYGFGLFSLIIGKIICIKIEKSFYYLTIILIKNKNKKMILHNL